MKWNTPWQNYGKRIAECMDDVEDINKQAQEGNR
jgi:hypothetical protein